MEEEEDGRRGAKLGHAVRAMRSASSARSLTLVDPLLNLCWPLAAAGVVTPG